MGSTKWGTDCGCTWFIHKIWYDIYADIYMWWHKCRWLYDIGSTGKAPMPGNEENRSMICINYRNEVIHCEKMAPLVFQGQLIDITKYNSFPYDDMIWFMMWYDMIWFMMWFIIWCDVWYNTFLSRQTKRLQKLGRTLYEFKHMIGPWLEENGALDHDQVWWYIINIINIIKHITNHIIYKIKHNMMI